MVLLFQEGQRVVPLRKTVGASLKHSFIWKEAQRIGQPFLYVTRIDDGYIVCHFISQRAGGHYFREEDLIPYQPNNQEVVHLLKDQL